MANLGGVYKFGTISIPNGGTTFTGTGTLWSPIAVQGDWILAGGEVSIITQDITDTTLKPEVPWTGPTLTNAPYVLIKMSWLRFEPAIMQQKVRELLAAMAGSRQFIYVEGAAPDPTIAAIEGQFALKVNAGRWEVWKYTGGEWISLGLGVGITSRGNWNPFLNYVANDVVNYGGTSYISLQPSTNQTPSTAVGYWSIFAQQGIQGIQGFSSWAPPIAWQAGVAYTAGPPASTVTTGGETYVCLVSHTSGVFSTQLAAGFWIKVAAKGVNGTGAGDMIASNALSEITNKVLAQTNIGIHQDESMPNGTDFNNMTIAGSYIPGYSNYGNIPYAGFWYLDVSTANPALYVRQVATLYLGGDEKWMRSKQGGTWTVWVRIATVADLAQKIIPSGADFNNITDAGSYIPGFNNNLNTPEAGQYWYLRVDTASAVNYVRQEAALYLGSDQKWIRTKQAGVWTLWKKIAQVVRHVFEGDSLTSEANGGIWYRQLKEVSSFFADGIIHNFALGGDVASAMVGEYATEAHTVAPLATGSVSYFYLYAGINDINASVAGATVYNYLKTLWASARADGYKVVAFTIQSYTAASAAMNTQRQILNELILSDPSLYDYVARVDLWFPDSNDRNYVLADGTHRTVKGNRMLARMVAELIVGGTTTHAEVAVPLTNVLINGGMEVIQHNAEATPTLAPSGAPSKACDGLWVVPVGSMSARHTIIADAPPGLTKSTRIDIVTAASLATGDFICWLMPIEGHRTAHFGFGAKGASPIVFGFWTKFNVVGTYGGRYYNPDASRNFRFSFTQDVADVWEFKQVIIPGCEDGSWPSNPFVIGSYLAIVVAAGAGQITANTRSWDGAPQFVNQAIPNGASSVGNVFRTTGWCMTSAFAGAFKAHHTRDLIKPFDQELLQCMRYYQKSYDYPSIPGTTGASGALSNVNGPTDHSYAGFGPVRFPVPMYKSPTVTLFSTNSGVTGKIYRANVGNDATAAASGISKYGFNPYIVNTVTAPYDTFSVHYTADGALL